jgi:hypothetical protein
MATMQETEALVVKRLDAHGDAVDRKLRQGFSVGRGDVVGIDLDGDFRPTPGPSLYGGERIHLINI